ncbi:imine reductase family protein [Streptomyces flavofungini]
MIRESEARSIDSGFPRSTLGRMHKAVENGHANDSYARLIERFRK